MLLLNNEPISAKDLASRFKIDLEKVQKTPVFQLGKQYQEVDKANGNVVKIPARVSFPTRTFVRDEDGNVLELVYAETRGFKTVGKERVPQYKPRYILFDALKNRVPNNIDKALFLKINANDRTSPFNKGGKYEYEHLDPQAIAKSRLESVNNVGKALSAISEMNDSDLIIFAKGLQASHKSPDKFTGQRFNPFPDGLDTHIDIVRVELMEFSRNNSEIVLQNLDNKLAKTKGQIINLIDKGFIVEYASHGLRYWKWEKGERAGQPIGNQIFDPHSDSREYLLNYLQSNLAEYYSDIHTTTASLSSDEQALAYLANKKEVEIEQEKEVDYSDLPQGYGNCQAWLGENGYSKAPALAKKLKEGIENKEVNNANIHGYVKALEAAMKEDNY